MKEQEIMSISKKKLEAMFITSRRVFLQEEKKYNGILKFAFVDNNETGETVFYTPDKTTADRVKKLLDVEFA
jgi:hypothetical protein